MPSALDLTTRALQMLAVIDAVETPSAEDGALGLDELNDLVDQLGTQRLTIYYLARTLKTLASGTATYTIGSGGSINIARPVWIENAGLIIDTSASPVTEIPIAVFTDDEWAGIAQKLLSSSLTLGIYYDHNWSAGLGLINIYPVPNVSTTQLVLYTPTAVTEFADLSTDYTFPPGYRAALIANLAMALAPYFPSNPPSDLVKQQAKDGMALIKRANFRLAEASIDRALLRRRGMGTMTESTFLSGQF